MSRLVRTHDCGGTIGRRDAAGVFGSSGGRVRQRGVGDPAAVRSWCPGRVLGRPTATTTGTASSAGTDTAAPGTATTAGTAPAPAPGIATAGTASSATARAPGIARSSVAAGGAWRVPARAAKEGHRQRQQQRTLRGSVRA